MLSFLPLIGSDQFIILLNDHCNLFHSNYQTHGCNTLGKVIYYMYIRKHTRKSEKDIQVWREGPIAKVLSRLCLSSPAEARVMYVQAQINQLFKSCHIYVNFPFHLWKPKIYFEKPEMNIGYQRDTTCSHCLWTFLSVIPFYFSLLSFFLYLNKNHMSFCFCLTKQNF